jgi:hypothetical protein
VLLLQVLLLRVLLMLLLVLLVELVVELAVELLLLLLLPLQSDGRLGQGIARHVRHGQAQAEVPALWRRGTSG